MREEYTKLLHKYNDIIDVLSNCEGAELEREIRKITGIE